MHFDEFRELENRAFHKTWCLDEFLKFRNFLQVAAPVTYAAPAYAAAPALTYAHPAPAIAKVAYLTQFGYAAAPRHHLTHAVQRFSN